MNRDKFFNFGILLLCLVILVISFAFGFRNHKALTEIISGNSTFVEETIP